MSVIRCDAIEEFYVDSKAQCHQLNLAHVARNEKVLKETKTNKRQCPLSSVQVKIRERSPEGTRETMEERICDRDEFEVWSERPRCS